MSLLCVYLCFLYEGVLRQYVCNFYESYSLIKKHVKIFENTLICEFFEFFKKSTLSVDFKTFPNAPIYEHFLNVIFG